MVANVSMDIKSNLCDKHLSFVFQDAKNGPSGSLTCGLSLSRSCRTVARENFSRTHFHFIDPIFIPTRCFIE